MTSVIERSMQRGLLPCSLWPAVPIELIYWIVDLYARRLPWLYRRQHDMVLIVGGQITNIQSGTNLITHSITSAFIKLAAMTIRFSTLINHPKFQGQPECLEISHNDQVRRFLPIWIAKGS